MFGSAGANAIEPTDWVACLSNNGAQVLPASVVFQRPPVAKAAYNISGWPGIPATSVERPLRLSGPVNRQTIEVLAEARNIFSCWANAALFWAPVAGWACRGPEKAEHHRKNRLRYFK